MLLPPLYRLCRNSSSSRALPLDFPSSVAIVDFLEADASWAWSSRAHKDSVACHDATRGAQAPRGRKAELEKMEIAIHTRNKCILPRRIKTTIPAFKMASLFDNGVKKWLVKSQSSAAVPPFHFIIDITCTVPSTVPRYLCKGSGLLYRFAWYPYTKLFSWPAVYGRHLSGRYIPCHVPFGDVQGTRYQGPII